MVSKSMQENIRKWKVGCIMALECHVLLFTTHF